MDESRTVTRSCPKCGAKLASDATAGLCPRCLMAAAMAQTDPGSEPAAHQKALSAAELAPHFQQLEILECLGRGGMGVVYKARQKSLNRCVALKLLAPERVGDPKFAERFTREAQALAALNHPNIVTIHDFGQAGGFYYLLMEFVDGVNLHQAMGAGRFTPEQALAIVPPVCEALQYAHRHGIVHRDIKPENLLLDKEGRVKIADFGVAKMLAVESSGVGLEESQPAGTPQYMAPEQKAHRATDHRADIYSLGVVLYEMLTGELPGKPIKPPSRKVRIDVRLDEVVLRALEKDPGRRYQHASEIKTVVETLMGAGAPTDEGHAQKIPCQSPATSLDEGRGPANAPPGNLPLFIEHAGRRRPYWPGVLLFCGTLGVAVLGVNLAIALLLWLLAGQPWPLFQPRELPWVLALMGVCAVMRLAALKLGASDRTRAESAPAAKVSTARLVTIGCLGMAVAGLIAAAVAVLVRLMAMEPMTSPIGDGSINDIARVAVWVVIAVASVAFIVYRVVRRRKELSGELRLGATPDRALWSPFQPPLIQEIWAHMTDAEKREAMWRTLLFGIWNAGTFFGPFFFIWFSSLPAPMAWIYGGAILVVGLSFYPLWLRMQREFLASTEWARQQGITADQLRLVRPGSVAPRTARRS